MSALSDSALRQLVGGKSFVLDAPDHVPAIMGRSDEVLWAEGESLLIVKPQGVGGTTLMQQIALRRAGVLEGDLIGYPVRTDPERLTLYLALDRPQQIARSFKRMVTDAQAQRLGQLIAWRGPLPFSVVKDPEMLAEFVQEVGNVYGTPVGSVFADSIKDMAAPLSSDEIGAGINRAIAGVIAAGVEFAATHHQRKATSENRKPRALDDVYGSTWITAGAGSVVLLWGRPGDPIVELTHLKQPAAEIGPLELEHDHWRGITTQRDRLDAWAVLQATTAGTTALEVAEAIYGANPTRAQVEKARRRLERFVADECAVKIEPDQKGDPTLYRAVALNGRRDPRDPSVTPHVTPSRKGHAPHESPQTLVTHPSRDPAATVSPPLGGGRDGEREHDEIDLNYLEHLAAEGEVNTP